MAQEYIFQAELLMRTFYRDYEAQKKFTRDLPTSSRKALEHRFLAELLAILRKLVPENCKEFAERVFEFDINAENDIGMIRSSNNDKLVLREIILQRAFECSGAVLYLGSAYAEDLRVTDHFFREKLAELSKAWYPVIGFQPCYDEGVTFAENFPLKDVYVDCRSQSNL